MMFKSLSPILLAVAVIACSKKTPQDAAPITDSSPKTEAPIPAPPPVEPVPATVPTQKELDAAVRAMVPSSLIKSVKLSKDKATVILKENPDFPDYFTSGDKMNKIFAIGSVRMFRDLPGLQELHLEIPDGGKTRTLHITRNDLIKHYGADPATFTGDAWRNDFLRNYDNESSRVDFAKSWVK